MHSLSVTRILPACAVAALLALAWFPPQAAAAGEVQRQTRPAPPDAEYSVHDVCGPPARGRSSCLDLELVPETSAARAHIHAPGATRAAGARFLGLSPQQLRGAYDLPASTPAAPTQKIALVDPYDDPSVEKDLKRYDEEYGLPVCTHANECFTKLNAEGRSKPLPEANAQAEVEISTDVEIAHAICQQCQILLVEADSFAEKDLEAAENRAVTEGATEISNSWYGEEPLTDGAAFDHPGTVITAAAGDEGYLDWDFAEEHEQGSVGYPASSPHVVAVGGTSLTLNSTSGAREDETVWNDSFGASGGGCSERFAAPPWQLELPDWPSIGCGSERAVADIAADADPYSGAAIFSSYWRVVGGTSIASPLIAATFALAGGAGGVEYPAETLYEHEAALYDVETGSNGECTKRETSEGVPACTAPEEAAASCLSRAICLAGPGYDGPSGVGAPDGIAAFEAGGKLAGKPQTIELTSGAPGAARVAGPTYTIAATATSGLGVSFFSGTPSRCSVTGSQVSFIEAGVCSILADQAGDHEYAPAPQARQSFAVAKGAQEIVFTSSAPAAATVNGPTYAVAATASSGLSVAFSSATPAICSVLGSTVSLISPGTCAILAAQPGNSNYKSAPETQQSFTVARKTQTIEFTSAAPDAASVGGSAYAVAASASSGLSVSFSSQTPSVCSVSQSIVAFIAAGTCTVTANQLGDQEYAAGVAAQSFAVAPAPSSPPASSGTLSFTASLAPDLTAPARSVFSLLGGPSTSRRSGAITLAVSVADRGSLSWVLRFPGSAKRCGARQTRCPGSTPVFGRGGTTVAAPGAVSFTVEPSAAAVRALRDARDRRQALVVTATITFRSARGAAPLTRTRSISDKLSRLVADVTS